MVRELSGRARAGDALAVERTRCGWRRGCTRDPCRDNRRVRFMEYHASNIATAADFMFGSTGLVPGSCGTE